MRRLIIPAAALAVLLGAVAPASAFESKYTGTTSQGLPISFTYDDHARGQRGGLRDVTFQIDFNCDGPGNVQTITPRFEGLVEDDGAFTVQNLHVKPDGMEGKLDLRGRGGQGLLQWHFCDDNAATTQATFTVRREGELPTNSRGQICNIVGTDAADTLDGTRFDDIICGFGGGDQIAAGRGNDVVEAGDGNDKIAGDVGDDVIVAGNGNDDVVGAAGDDRIQGGRGNDDLGGSAGDDTIEGGRGNDDVGGGTGADRLTGGAGRDTLDGGAGGDRIIGGTGRDTLTGGRGNDLLRSIDAFADTLSCGDGVDRVEADRRDTRKSC